MTAGIAEPPGLRGKPGGHYASDNAASQQIQASQIQVSQIQVSPAASGPNSIEEAMACRRVIYRSLAIWLQVDAAGLSGI
jgi:hypothetical protein